MDPDSLTRFISSVAGRHHAREERIGATRRIVELTSGGEQDGEERAAALPVVSLKTLYTDFEVRELPAFYRNGAPLALELHKGAAVATGVAPDQPNKRPREIEAAARAGEAKETEVETDAVAATASVVIATSTTASSAVTSTIGPLVSTDDLARLLVGLAEEARAVPLPSVTDKEKRTELHKAIKACLGGTHVSNTVDGVVTVVKANAADRREERRRSRVSRPPPKYHHFTLYKENTDSNQALRMLAGHLKLSLWQLQFCGTKDKRAVTLQRVAVKETTVERLRTVNERTFGPHNVIKVCGFTEEEHGLRLGDALGNHFRIVLRAFPGGTGADAPPAATAARLLEVERVVRERGVVNYFGPQRFGTTDVLTSDVGVQFLQGHLREGLRLMLVSKGSMVPEMQRVVELYDASDYAAALQASPYYCYQERDVLKHLCANPNDFLGALQAMARTMAMMYFHAVQSLVWNRIASARLSSAARVQAEVGDLVLESTYQARFAGAEPAPRCGEEEAKLPTVRQLTADDDCTRFGLADVVLPVPGPDQDLVYPACPGCTRADYDAVLAALGVDFSLKETLALTKVFHFHGTYRSLGVRPTDFALRLETVASWRAPVLESDWERHCRAEGLPLPSVDAGELAPRAGTAAEPAGSVQAIVASFALPPGCYATSVLREFCIASTETFQRTDAAAGGEEEGQVEE